jgi:ribosomal protein L28
MRSTKRVFTPNIQKKRIFDKKTGRWVRVKLATSVIRTMTKDQRKAQKKIKEEMEEVNV